MNTASTMDGDAEWLRDKADLLEAGDPRSAPWAERMRRIASRLSTIPSAGELRELLKEARHWLDFHPNAHELSDQVDAALSIQTISGKGMREALEKIAGGFVPDGTTMIVEGRWRDFVNALQAIARAALVDQGERG